MATCWPRALRFASGSFSPPAGPTDRGFSGGTEHSAVAQYRGDAAGVELGGARGHDAYRRGRGDRGPDRDVGEPGGPRVGNAGDPQRGGRGRGMGG